MSRIEDNYLSRLIGLDHKVATLVRIDLDVPVYVNDQLRSYDYDGNTYIAVGALGSIGNFEEDTELTPSRLTLTLSGIPTYLIDVLTQENYQNRAVYIYSAILDDNGDIIRDPILAFKGVTGNVKIPIGATASIQLDVINSLTLWKKIVGYRYNNVTQEKLYPGDTSLQYVYAAQKGVVWRGVSD